jgi:hypothetical protein
VATETRNPADYEALGILRETWACIAALDKRDATRYLFDLAASGVPALLSRDADGKRWHVAVRGGMAANPAAWVASFRGSDLTNIPTCPDTAVVRGGQHPQEGREPRDIRLDADDESNSPTQHALAMFAQYKNEPNETNEASLTYAIRSI